MIDRAMALLKCQTILKDPKNEASLAPMPFLAHVKGMLAELKQRYLIHMSEGNIRFYSWENQKKWIAGIWIIYFWRWKTVKHGTRPENS